MFGKVQVNNTSGVATNVRCTLTADDESDISLVRLPVGGITTISAAGERQLSRGCSASCGSAATRSAPRRSP